MECKWHMNTRGQDFQKAELVSQTQMMRMHSKRTPKVSPLKFRHGTCQIDTYCEMHSKVILKLLQMTPVDGFSIRFHALRLCPCSVGRPKETGTRFERCYLASWEMIG